MLIFFIMGLFIGATFYNESVDVCCYKVLFYSFVIIIVILSEFMHRNSVFFLFYQNIKQLSTKPIYLHIRSINWISVQRETFRQIWLC